jgi:ATP-dependent phosphoenolpyruvate carboxykinase
LGKTSKKAGEEYGVNEFQGHVVFKKCFGEAKYF